MPRFDFTASQMAHLKALKEMCKSMHVDGYDLANRIVVTRTDRRGTVQYSIRQDGSGTQPVEPIVQFTIDDLYELPNEQYHTLVVLTGVEEEITT